MTTRREMDPEVRALLEEVASDPRSHLLRVPDLHEPIRFETPVGPSAAFLASPERELLHVHRADLADLLYDATRLALLEHRSAELLRWTAVGRHVDVPTREEALDRARRRMSTMPSALRADDGFSLLERCVAGETGKRPTAVQLAAATLRLRPHDGARTCMALAFQQAGQPQTALNLLGQALELHPSHMSALFMWENLGMVLADLGRLDASRSAYRQASISTEPRITPAMNLFVLALHERDRAAVIDAAAELEDSAAETDPALDAFICGLQDGSSRHPDHRLPAHEFIRSVYDRAPAAARRILDVYS